MLSKSTANDGLMKIVAHHNEVTRLYQQFSEAENVFVRKWEAVAPVNPVAEGFAATILDVFYDQKLVMVDYIQGIVYPFTVAGSIKRQYLPYDQLVVADARGTKRSLDAMGILPRADNDRWHAGRLTVVDTFENISQLTEFLYSEDSDGCLSAAENVVEYMFREYWADFPQVYYDDELPSLHDDD